MLKKILFFLIFISQIYATNLKVGLITGYGGLGDFGFNDIIYRGGIDAQNKFNIPVKIVAPKDNEKLTSIAKKLIEKEKCNFIIFGEAVGGKKVIPKLARKYPKTDFVLLDGTLREYRSNTSSVTFSQNEGSFLAGYLAAAMSKTKIIGFVGGMNIPVINDFFVGYKAGAHYFDKKIIILKKYIEGKKPWSDPETAYKKTETLIKKGADVIYVPAGASNLGVFNACKKHNKYAIGTDVDQDYLVKGTILTSVIKRMDLAIQYVINLKLKNKLKNRNYVLGLGKGISLSPMHFTKDKIPPHILKKIDELRKKIIRGEIKITKEKNL